MKRFYRNCVESRNCKIVQKLQSALHFALIALDHKIFLEIIFNYSGSWSIIIMNGNDDVGDYDNDEDDDNDLSCMKVVSKWGALLCLICNEQKWSHFDILNLQQGQSSSSLSSFCLQIFFFSSMIIVHQISRISLSWFYWGGRLFDVAGRIVIWNGQLLALLKPATMMILSAGKAPFAIAIEYPRISRNI